jgi:ketosteroid isomerase-like protein
LSETLIRQRVEDLAKSIGAKDVDGVIALYARDLVSIDLTPPLRHVATDEERRAGRDMFAEPLWRPAGSNCPVIFRRRAASLVDLA